MSASQPETVVSVAEPASGAILEARHLQKLFPLRRLNPFGPQRAVHAIEDSSLALYPGRATALVGNPRDYVNSR